MTTALPYPAPATAHPVDHPTTCTSAAPSSQHRLHCRAPGQTSWQARASHPPTLPSVPPAHHATPTMSNPTTQGARIPHQAVITCTRQVQATAAAQGAGCVRRHCSGSSRSSACCVQWARDCGPCRARACSLCVLLPQAWSHSASIPNQAAETHSAAGPVPTAHAPRPGHAVQTLVPLQDCTCAAAYQTRPIMCHSNNPAVPCSPATHTHGCCPRACPCVLLNGCPAGGAVRKAPAAAAPGNRQCPTHRWPWACLHQQSQPAPGVIQ